MFYHIVEKCIFANYKKNKNMATIVRKNANKFSSAMMREKIFVGIPQSDMIFFKLFAEKMGWKFNNKQNLWDEYIKNCPKNTDLSEEEILEEARTVRYGMEEVANQGRK